jgi:hypothetical protein
MTELTKLHARLVEMDVRKFNIFPGTNPNATPEQIAAAINRALDAIEAGKFEEVCLD